MKCRWSTGWRRWSSGAKIVWLVLGGAVAALLAQAGIHV